MYDDKKKQKIWWSLGIRLHYRTERLGLSLKSTWINQFSSRQKRKCARAEVSGLQDTFSLVETQDENLDKGGQFILRKTAKERTMRTLALNWHMIANRRHLCKNCSDEAGQSVLNGWCLHGASPGSLLLLSSLPFSDYPLAQVTCFHRSEVPRRSQTHRDQVGTSNWVEALQILTHLFKF